MNLGMFASTIAECRFFLRTSISFKKVSIKREGQQKFFSKVLPFAVSNHNNEQ